MLKAVIKKIPAFFKLNLTLKKTFILLKLNFLY